MNDLETAVMDITYDEWMSQTKKRFHRRSTELRRVDTAFKAFQKGKDKKLNTTDLMRILARHFKVWTGIKGGDHLSSIRNRKKNANDSGPVERLQSLIRTQKYSNITVLRDLNAEVPDKLVLDSSLSCNAMDKAKVTETYNRSKKAVHKARDILLKAKSAGAARDLYERWFGAYDATRHASVISNYNQLCKLFTSGVIIVHDARQQMDVWGDCFGFATPGNKQNYVEFTVGRAFFMKTGFNVPPGATAHQRSAAVKLALANAYNNTSDWTVGTMIHELGHATNNLPDVDYQAPSTYQVSPGGITPSGWDQCSTPDLDLALALNSPALAVVNTDSYGQCAREALAL